MALSLVFYFFAINFYVNIEKTKGGISYGILSYLQMTVICKDFSQRVHEIYIKNPSPLTSGYIDFIHFI